MASGKKEKLDRKMLSAWDPPDGAGRSVGCVATTFTFSPVFFEEECLSRFLQMQSDALEDGPVYIIEREEKLADVSCATVLVDACHCKGSRSLRWDLLPARLPKAILHAKISLLCWLNHVRIIIASANLTEDGYRRNQEIFGYVDFYEGSDAPLAFLRDITSFLRQALIDGKVNAGEETPPAFLRWNSFLDTVDEMSNNWGNTRPMTGNKNVRIHAILTGPGRGDALSQVMKLWPESTPPIHAFITSPFFDPTGNENQPAKSLWQILRQRGNASVTYNLLADDEPDENMILLRAPRELIEAEPFRETATTQLRRIYEKNDEKEDVFRPLHLKSLWLGGNDWHAYLIGSGNFTSRGLGIAKAPNLEASILYLVNQRGNPQAFKALKKSQPETAAINKKLTKKWAPSSDAGKDAEDPNIIVLPAFFSTAVFFRKENKNYIRFEFCDHPPSGWQIWWGTLYTKEILDERAWESRKSPRQVEVEWDEGMAPSGFEVSWSESPGRAWWPVNVDRAASLPPPEELKDLPLDLLINILTSARPLHQVLKNWIKKKGQNDDFGYDRDIIDPHKRVDTSAFLLQKTYRITAALSGLRARLERPAMSVDAIEWRLKGPIGVQAVKKAILKEARSSDEQVFLLAELGLEIARVNPTTAPGCMSVKAVRQQIHLMLLELKKETMAVVGNSPPALKEYVRAAFSEVLS